MRFAQGSGRAWVRPGGDPGPLDRCLLLTDVVFKDDRPTSRRTSHRYVPTRCESLRFHAACPLRRTVGPRSGCCLPRPPFRRRTSDAPSPAGFPGRAMSAGVGPRSLARSQVETRKPRPTRPSRVNGSLGLALARSTLSLRSFVRPDRRPDPAALAAAFFSEPRSLSGRDLTRVERELLPCHRPTRHNACLQSSRCSSALLSKRGIPSGVTASFPKPPSNRWSRPAKATVVVSCSFEPSRTRSHTTLTVSPDELGTDIHVVGG